MQTHGRPTTLEIQDATYFVTFSMLDRELVDLTRPAIGQMIVGAFRHFDEVRYLLFDYTVMPDHVHLIMKPLVVDGTLVGLSSIYHSLKSFTAHGINKLLRRRGPVWQDGSYERVLRSRKDYEEKAKYIFMNPVARGLVRDPSEWPWWGKGSGEV